MKVTMGKSNIKKVLGGLAFVIGVITFPIVMDKWIIGNSIPSNISNSDWVSFLGNYAGGILGGIFTLVALYITIGSERKNIGKY